MSRVIRVKCVLCVRRELPSDQAEGDEEIEFRLGIAQFVGSATGWEWERYWDALLRRSIRLLLCEVTQVSVVVVVLEEKRVAGVRRCRVFCVQEIMLGHGFDVCQTRDGISLEESRGRTTRSLFIDINRY